MNNHNIIVVGASAGGVTALIALTKSLPQNFKGSVFVVLHISAAAPSYLPTILSRAGHLKAIHPKDGEKIEGGMIYIAPSDHHLLIDRGIVMVKKGPKENRFRPSIDALFRSAAYVYGPRVIGIVLSGLLNDGTSGLWSIKRLGGKTMIQDPEDAEFPTMPQSVLEYVDVDYTLPVAAMGAVLQKLAEERHDKKPIVSKQELKLLEMEIAIATKDGAFERGILKMGTLTPYTCPECHGALVQLIEGKMIRFRCHTGHAYSSNALLAGISKSVEETLWQAMRGLEEATMLLQDLATVYKEGGHTEEYKIFQQKAQTTATQARMIHKSVFNQEPISEEILLSNKKGGTIQLKKKK